MLMIEKRSNVNILHKWTELRAKLSYSDHFVVGFRLSVFVFTFSTSYPEPINRFLPNLAHNILL